VLQPDEMKGKEMARSGRKPVFDGVVINPLLRIMHARLAWYLKDDASESNSANNNTIGPKKRVFICGSFF